MPRTPYRTSVEPHTVATIDKERILLHPDLHIIDDDSRASAGTGLKEKGRAVLRLTMERLVARHVGHAPWLRVRLQ